MLPGDAAAAWPLSPRSPHSAGTHAHQTWQILVKMAFSSKVLHPAASPVGGGLAGDGGRGAICAGTAASPFPSAGMAGLWGGGTHDGSFLSSPVLPLSLRFHNPSKHEKAPPVPS